LRQIQDVRERLRTRPGWWLRAGAQTSGAPR
jgi:hypothetical protein